jgi:hypothetical protein
LRDYVDVAMLRDVVERYGVIRRGVDSGSGAERESASFSPSRSFRAGGTAGVLCGICGIFSFQDGENKRY